MSSKDMRKLKNFFLESEKSLASVTWARGVNNKTLLSLALSNNKQMMLESDVILGGLGRGHAVDHFEPVIGHTAQKTSDLSVRLYIQKIIRHNRCQQYKKGIKLNFKSHEACESTILMLQAMLNHINFPVWLHADILAGGEGGHAPALTPERFLSICNELPEAVVSVGWTNTCGFLPSCMKTYTTENVHEMLYQMMDDEHDQIIFNVRAGIAEHCYSRVMELLNSKKCFLAIVGNNTDTINLKKMKKLIKAAGPNRVFLDMPNATRKQLLQDLHKKSVTDIVFNWMLLAAAMAASFMLAVNNQQANTSF